jgi:D-glycero-D-manno-heptose 1,7-bisphosphate phosphatase
MRLYLNQTSRNSVGLVPPQRNTLRPYPALFLDRDGVVNKEKGIFWRSDLIEFMPGIFELVGDANRLGLRVVIITNQSGIGRGLFSEAQFSDLMHWMCDKFVERGAHIDAVYFSPFHPTAGVGVYRRDSDCRKPNPGMFFSAMADFDINLRASIMLGDNDSDMRAAAAAGIPHRWLVHSGQAARSIAATLVEVSLPMAREQLAMIYSPAY